MTSRRQRRKKLEVWYRYWYYCRRHKAWPSKRIGEAWVRAGYRAKELQELMD